MKQKTIKKETSSQKIGTEDLILHEAAKLITEKKEVSISLLAEKTGKSRVSIHSLFGKGQKDSATKIIYQRIVEAFLKNTERLAANFLFALGLSASPIEQLIVVFRAILVAFREDPVFGRVVAAYHFDLKNNDILERLFKNADALFAEARKQNLLSEQASYLEGAKLRGIMFRVICGLLTSVDLEETENSETLSISEVEIEVLHIFQVYCADEAAAKIEESVQAIRKMRTNNLLLPNG